VAFSTLATYQELCCLRINGTEDPNELARYNRMSFSDVFCPSHLEGCRMRSAETIRGLLNRRDALVSDFAKAITVADGRRAGSKETRLAIDLRYPDVGRECEGRPARWRLRTERNRLAHSHFPRPALVAFHRADPQKGRRLIVADLRNENRAVALMAWHFDAASSRGGRGRPHLVVALAFEQEVCGRLRGEYLVACWLLCLIGLAIDRRTVRKGRIGVELDAAIAVNRHDLAALGFTKGSRRAGYRGNYFELSA
jgi:hypothetical protein